MRARTAATHRQPHLLGLLLAFLSSIALAEPARQILFVSGGGIAVDSAGNTRAVEKDAALDEGDTILTKDGLVQIRFKDGAFVALQPQTEFKVERYRHTAAGDSEDGAIMSLLKGGLRTISGLVGKRDRNAYSMKAAVATIGIRGTDYALQLNDKLVGNVSDGAIEVCNGAGCVGVLAGQAFLVPSLTDIPVLSERQVLLPPPQPRQTSKVPAREVADGQQAADEAALEDHTGENAKQNTVLERVRAPTAADPTAAAGRGKAVYGSPSTSAVAGRLNPAGAATVPPGQAKGSGADDVLSVLPPPAASPSVPPGQAKKSGADILLVLPPPASNASVPPGQVKKLDAGVLDAVRANSGKALGLSDSIPPGQAKR
jgi:hypothetical protein